MHRPQSLLAMTVSQRKYKQKNKTLKFIKTIHVRMLLTTLCIDESMNHQEEIQHLEEHKERGHGWWDQEEEKKMPVDYENMQAHPHMTTTFIQNQ